MKQRILDVLSTFALLTAFGLAAALVMPRAYAEMIPTQPADERSRVKAMLERPEVVREMGKMGIPPEKAVERVDALSDAEVSQLAGRLGALPAGAAMSNQELLLVIIIVLLLVILL